MINGAGTFIIARVVGREHFGGMGGAKLLPYWRIAEDPQRLPGKK